MSTTGDHLGLHGQRYRPSLVARVPAAAFECELCPFWYDLWRHLYPPDRLVLGWDHCHTHDVIRGVLCIRCNLVLREVDSGFDLDVLKKTLGLKRRRGAPRGWARWGEDAEMLRAWRMRCPQCTGDYPPLALWIVNDGRRKMVVQARTALGGHPECARCPVMHAAYGVAISLNRRVTRREVVMLNARGSTTGR